MGPDSCQLSPKHAAPHRPTMDTVFRCVRMGPPSDLTGHHPTVTHSSRRRRITVNHDAYSPRNDLRELFRMDIEARLRKLESRYRAALSAAVAAKANYLALAGEPSATPATVERAKSHWQTLASRKRTIAAQMGELEAL